MADYKKALKELNQLHNTNTTEGKIKEHDMYCGLADRIIEKHWDKQDKQWKVEYANEILNNKEC